MNPLDAVLYRQLAGRIVAGRLTVILPDGRRELISGANPGPEAVIEVKNNRLLRKLLLGGGNGFAEAYIEGDFDSPDLTAMLLFGAANYEAWGALMQGRWPLRLAARLAHCLRPNSRKGSRRNIAAHYDLGNAFYALWLDRGLTYSAAVFAEEDQALEAAQDNKYRLICDRAGIREGDRVLEIGCGWGGFASYAARERQAKVTAVTISDAQYRAAAARMQSEGLAERVTIEKRDYRDLSGHYRAIAAIEMVEAVGERYWPTFFGKLKSLTRPGGRVALQAITIDEKLFPRYRRSADFIQRHVFPGGMLPSAEAIRLQAERSELKLSEECSYAQHYARTLAQWRQRFEAAWQDIAAMGYDQRFRRLWRYYLSYCEAGFRAGRTDLKHFAFTT